MTDINVIFMGTPIFACGILETLLDMKLNVVAVVSQPDKKVGRKQLIEETPVKQLAKQHQLPVVQPLNIKTDYDEVLHYKPDLIVTCAYGQIVPKALLEYPKLGCINVHASLLPAYRGGAPIHKAVIDGCSETGVTIMKMVEKMDAGDMYYQKKVPILLEDTMIDVYHRLIQCGQECLLEVLPAIILQQQPSVKQDEDLVSYAYNISKDNERISFNRPVLEVYNHARGLIDWPVGYAILADKKIKFHQVSFKEEQHSYEIGQLLSIDKNVAICCLDGYLLVSKLQVEGKNTSSAIEFLNGWGKNKIGQCFQ